jgi:hypothetical protein
MRDAIGSNCSLFFNRFHTPMPSSRKKVIVRKLSREWLAGYLPPADFAHRGSIELLDLGGKALAVPLDEMKWICFVRDFNSGESDNPERLLRKTFAGRPRSEGLWLRLRLTDGDSLEGLATNDLGLLDPAGVFLAPPDIRSNTQRIFLPRNSIAELEVVAVITNPSRKKAAAVGQGDLFDRPE